MLALQKLLGGGLGVRYVQGDKSPSIGEYAKRLTGSLHKEIGENIDLLVEPGRSLIAPVGLTMYRIVTVKRTTRTYVAVDGGMGDKVETDWQAGARENEYRNEDANGHGT